MRIVGGRAETPSGDREVTNQVVASVAESGDAAIRIWQPPEQVAFGRRDATRPGYEHAREEVTDRGIPAIERSTGGHAVYFTGTTMSFLLAEPVADQRTGIDDRYEATIEPLQSALGTVGVAAWRGEPADSFCPGSHSLSAEGKIVGLAQRVRQEVAVVAGIVVLSDHEAIASVLDPIYDALGVPFDPGSVGSVARAGETADPEAVRAAIESSLTLDSAHVRRESVDEYRSVERSH
jgi:octanoyl-[GcvH]:protein N-octanoyltransferase